MWRPASKESILKDIEYCNDILSLQPDCLKFWEYVKIEPEKWIEKTMAEINGFWVVAIMGKSIIYYNDVEEGYNCSPFTTYGIIDEYYPVQIELYQMIESLYEEIIKAIK